MGRAAAAEQAVERAVAIRLACDSVDDPVARRRLLAVERDLRWDAGVGVPKQRAAALVGISVPALQKWIDRGAIPTVKRPGSQRVEVDTEALVELVAEVRRLREQGAAGRVAARAIRSLQAHGRLRRRPRPNQAAAELRHAFETTSALERMRDVDELSHALGLVAQAKDGA